MISKTPELLYFNNGLRLIFQENNSSPVVTTQAWVNAGSADETNTQLGMAHVLEHMIFKGTKKYPGEIIAKLIETNGGEINAFTSFDQTVYHMTIASQYVDLSIDIISEMVQNPIIEDESLEKEKEVILEEIKRSYDAPGREVSKLLFATAFKGHPYSRPIIGTKESVISHTRSSIFKFFKKWYAPNNIIIIIIGNASKEHVIHQIETHFKCKISKLENPEKTFKPLKRLRPAALEQRSPRFEMKFKNVNEAFIDIAFPVPNINHPDTAALDVLCGIMGQGDTSHLYHNIKFTRQLVNDIAVYSYTPKDQGIILISTTLNPNNLMKSTPEVIKEIVNFKHKTPTKKDLDKAKINILSEHIFQKETVDGQARKLGLYYTMSGSLNFEENYHRNVEACTMSQIFELSQKYLNVNKINAVCLLPEKFKNNFTKKSFKEITIAPFKKQESLSKGISSETLKKANLQNRKSSLSNIVIHTLDSGVKLVLKHNPFVPITAVRAAMLGGVRFESDKDNGSFAMLARMFTMGTRNKTATEISNLIESKASSIAGYSGKNSFGLEGEFLSQYLDEGLELFCENLLFPIFPEKQFENERKNVLEHIRVIQDNPANYVFQLFAKNMFKIHPYRYSLLGTSDSVNGLSRQNLTDIHQKLIHPDNLFISVVGDIDVEYTIKKLTHLLEPLDSAPSIFPNIKKEANISKPIEQHTPLNKHQTHILYGFRGTTIGNKDRYTIDLIQALLSGQGGRLFTKLRDEMALAYSVFATSMEGLDPGYFSVYIACSPDKKASAITALKEELNKLKDKKITTSELNRAKKYLIGKQAIEMQRNYAQAFSLLYDELYQLGTGHTAKFADYINAVTATDILNAANKYFDHSKSVLTSLGQ